MWTRPVRGAAGHAGEGSEPPPKSNRSPQASIEAFLQILHTNIMLTYTTKESYLISSDPIQRTETTIVSCSKHVIKMFSQIPYKYN